MSKGAMWGGDAHRCAISQASILKWGRLLLVLIVDFANCQVERISFNLIYPFASQTHSTYLFAHRLNDLIELLNIKDVLVGCKPHRLMAKIGYEYAHQPWDYSCQLKILLLLINRVGENKFQEQGLLGVFVPSRYGLYRFQSQYLVYDDKKANAKRKEEGSTDDRGWGG